MDYFEKDFVGDDIIYKPTRNGAAKSKKYIEHSIDDMIGYVKRWEKTGKKRGVDFNKKLTIMRNDDADFDLRLKEYKQKATAFNKTEYGAINYVGAGAAIGTALAFGPVGLGVIGGWIVGAKLDARRQKNRIRRANKIFERLQVQ